MHFLYRWAARARQASEAAPRERPRPAELVPKSPAKVSEVTPERRSTQPFHPKPSPKDRGEFVGEMHPDLRSPSGNDKSVDTSYPEFGRSPRERKIHPDLSKERKGRKEPLPHTKFPVEKW